MSAKKIQDPRKHDGRIPISSDPASLPEGLLDSDPDPVVSHTGTDREEDNDGLGVAKAVP